MEEFKPGQRWVSRSEPELGLGEITEVDLRKVTCVFAAADTRRQYATADAPLIRVRFNPSDELIDKAGQTFTVESVSDRDGLLFYKTTVSHQPRVFCEIDLNPTLQFSQPQDRLFLNQIDSNDAFNLRLQSLEQQAKLERQPFRGLLGPRTALLPHQLYIAQQVSESPRLRALLADEVGLGKTIEAGLILSKMLQTARGSRAIILVPEALKIQWLVEMVRRFNLEFTILDEAQCQALAEAESESGDVASALGTSGFNPFLAQQLVITDLNLLTNDPRRCDQALAAPWDMVIVDEAHHLRWDPEDPSPAYTVTEKLARQSPGLLLLSATPEQFGQAGHYARLRLIDPERYPSLADYQEEQQNYIALANLIKVWQSGGVDALEARLALIDKLLVKSTISDEELLASLLDQFGPGTSLFRNRRSDVVTPIIREVIPCYLDIPEGQSESFDQAGFKAKLQWLGAEVSAAPDKFLVICRLAEHAIQIEQHLRRHFGLRSSCFHEHLDLVARDRAAAYFADTEHGAQVLVCSEIGSEGRNFQFAHHLVMFDMPDSGDLIEQRIGRLDRIGQTHKILIHLPLIQGSPDDRRFQWYHKGLNLFNEPNPAGAEIERQLNSQFEARIDSAGLENLIVQSQAAVASLKQQLEQGKDLLLELASFDPDAGQAITEGLEIAEATDALEQYLTASFDYFGLSAEPLTSTINLVKPTPELQSHNLTSEDSVRYLRYPELPEVGLSYTYDRATALRREDIQFLSWEHPLVTQAFDRVLSDQTGNAAITLINRAELSAGTLLVEAIFRIDCTAPVWLGLQQHVQKPLLRFVIGPDRKEFSKVFPSQSLDDALPAKTEPLARLIGLQRAVIQSMLDEAHRLATIEVTRIRASAQESYQAKTQKQLQRLEDLSRRNPNISKAMVAQVLEEQSQGNASLEQLAPRLDAIRVIIGV